MSRTKNRKKRRMGRIDRQYRHIDSYWNTYNDRSYYCDIRYYMWCGFSEIQNWIAYYMVPHRFLNKGEYLAVYNHYLSTMIIPKKYNRKKRYCLLRLIQQTIERNKKTMKKYNVPINFADYFLNGMYKSINTLSVLEDDVYLIEYFKMTLPERIKLEETKTIQNLYY